MAIDVQVVMAFVDEGKGGNPAGVVLDADRFTAAQKQDIAARVGLSETAFVSASASADVKLEFFTPNRQIPHCGHATVATFSYLQQLGTVRGPASSKETIDGNRAIRLDGDMAFMEQRAPRYTALPHDGVSTEDVLASIGLRHEDVMPGRAPVIVHTGNAFLIVPLKDERIVLSARQDEARVGEIGERLGLVGYYLFSRETRLPGRAAGARMFAPHYGIPEEAATGMAAGPLACYLHDVLKLEAGGDILIEQGHLMSPASPSVIHVRLDVGDTGIRSLMAGGRAKVVERRTVSL